MEFSRQNPSARFSVPDRITVRQQLTYYSEARVALRPLFERLWAGALPLITNWECEVMPDPQTDLDSISATTVTQVIVWAGLEVKGYLDSLDEMPKN